MAIRDVHAFVGTVDYFALMEDDEYTMGMMLQPSEEPEPKRQKLDLFHADGNIFAIFFFFSNLFLLDMYLTSSNIQF